MNIEKKSYECAAIRVCVDIYEAFCIRGKIHSPFWEKGIAFHDVASFLIALENLSEDRGFPDPMFKHRSFQSLHKNEDRNEEAKVVRSVEQIEKEYGEKETMRLFITGRRNAGIQGYFVCLSTGNIYKYSSELQLLQRMEQVFSSPSLEKQDTGTQKFK